MKSHVKIVPKVYIGMTERKVATRMKEHKRDIQNKNTNSALAKHSMVAGHNIDTEKFNIMSKASGSRDLLLSRESILINTSKDTVNKIESAPHPSLINFLRKAKKKK